MKLSDILANKRKTDMNGLRNAQRNGTMAEYLRDDLIAAGINPDDVIFGGNPDLAVGSAKTVSKNLSSGLGMLAKYQTASGTLTNKPVEKFLDAEEATAPVPKCPSCAKPVYHAEEILFQEVPWHKNCFKCGGLGELGCGRLLRKGEYQTQADLPYCSACFTHLFQLGAARGTVLNTEVVQPRQINTSDIVVEPVKKLSIAERVAALQNKVNQEQAK